MKKAIIIGAGPAGLTAAYELLTKTDILPVVIEKDSQVGGLAKTINYKGNRIDIGGHRFFSKSDKVIEWWLKFLPLDESIKDDHLHLTYQHKDSEYNILPSQFGNGENVMLLRPRKSRIYHQHQFFDYPLKMDFATIKKLGFAKTFQIAFSYAAAKISPTKPEKNLEDFFCNRFGKKLYETFFKDYTEKVWGIPCNKIPASWGAQRIKDLNISRLLAHAFISIFKKDKTINQEKTSTSLIEQFLYPKYGPGQMWETVAGEIEKLGGKIYLNAEFNMFECDGEKKILSAQIKNNLDDSVEMIQAEYFFSTMPVKELIAGMNNIEIDKHVKRISAGLEYRDFLIVGILASKLNVNEDNSPIKDNWIYIQDKEIKAGRLQIFNNWSPFMVSNSNDTWIGVEYFCNEGDEFWKMKDDDIISIAISEMQKTGILLSGDVKDAMVARVLKAYPSYYGSYENFDAVKQFLDSVENLYPIGRNGMHRYNNSDHSMLTAMAAVDNIISGKKSKQNIWDINTEDEYHEEK